MSIEELLTLEPESTRRLHQLWLGYTESPGDPTLRATISEQYEQISADEVLVHAGAEEAIFNFMNALLGPDDHIIVQWPGYQSLAEVAHAIGCNVTPWHLTPDFDQDENGWRLDLDFIREHLRPNTRAIVINSPHNPTGFLAGRSLLDALVQLAETNDLLVFSDEVYRGLEYNEADRNPALCDLTEQAVSLGVMSKTYGLAGLRIGWIATRNKPVYEAMAAFKDYTTICNSAPSELLATIALSQADQIVKRNLTIIEKNLDLLDHFFEKYAERFDWRRPAAGAIAFPRLHNGETAEPFCERLVKEAGVLLLPGQLFDPAYASHFRIGFARRNMPEALEHLDQFLSDHPMTLQ